MKTSDASIISHRLRRVSKYIQSPESHDEIIFHCEAAADEIDRLSAPTPKLELGLPPTDTNSTMYRAMFDTISKNIRNDELKSQVCEVAEKLMDTCPNPDVDALNIIFDQLKQAVDAWKTERR